MKCFIKHLLTHAGIALLCGALVWGGAAQVQGEMWEEMENLSQALNLHADGWSVQQTHSPEGGPILWPGESAELTFFVKPETPYQGKVKLEVVRYGTRSREDDSRKPVFYLIETLGTVEVEAEIPSAGQSIRIRPEIAETLGAYALVMELEGRGRAFAGSFVRVVEPSGLAQSRSGKDLSIYQKLGIEEHLLQQGAPEKRNASGVRIAQSEEDVAATLCLLRALGQDLSPAINKERLLTKEWATVGDQEFELWQAWPAGAAVAVAQKWIGQQTFKKLLFPSGLPWVFVFEEDGASHQGKGSKRALAEEGTLVVIGDLKGTYVPDQTPWRSVLLNPGACFVIENPRNEFQSYDFYGNPLEQVGNQLAIPLNGCGYYVKTTGRSGSFKRLMAAAALADIRNVESVEIKVQDFRAPVEKEGTTLRVLLHNVLNRRVEGTLQVLVPGVVLESEIRDLTLKPYQTREIEFKIVNHLSQKRNANNYPLVIAWESEGYTIKHAETLHVNSIERGTPTVDGKLDEWRDRLAQSTSLPITQEAEAGVNYRPFNDWPSTTERDTLSGWLAWDDDSLYFAVRSPLLNESEKNCHLELALNANPDKKKKSPFLSSGMPEEFFSQPGSDYELGFYPGPGGQTEMLFLRAPATHKGGQALGGNSQVVRKGRFWEGSISWDQIPEIQARVFKGKPIQFNYRFDTGQRAWELAHERSTSHYQLQEGGTFHWANQLRFGIEENLDRK